MNSKTFYHSKIDLLFLKYENYYFSLAYSAVIVFFSQLFVYYELYLVVLVHNS